ncbi:TadE family protein [Ramlibacter sp.]|uniref:TadE/TadG family type IV pilus assembly protein n=1 Tax=Ramlibacter sp. TaxID=1917967 RepID=UPI002D4963BD|nr:TadE family protein [Ramlibacter sp.]HYD77927.1 TadE family protein [Ramlibacter sp.]
MARYARRQSGVAIVEFALILPMLLVLTFITTEFGRALHQYNTIVKSVRDAARYLSIQTPGDTTAMLRARNLVVYGDPGGSGTPIVPGLALSHVPDPVWSTSGTAPAISAVTIRVSGYTFQPMFPAAFGHTFTLPAFSDITATMRSHV